MPGQEPVGSASSKPRRLPLILALVAAVLVLVVALVVVVPLVLGEDETATAIIPPYGPPITEAGPTGEPDSEEDWRADVDCEVSCDLAADADRVYVAEGGESADDGSAGESEISAYDAGSGEEAWDDVVTVDGYAELAPIEQGLIVSSDDESILLDPSSGEERWSVNGSLAGVGEDVLIFVEYEVSEDGDGETDTSTSRMVDPESGDVLWDTQDGVGLCGNTLIAADEGDVSAVDTESGEKRWTHDAGESEGGGAGGCNDEVLAYAFDGELTVISLDDGEELGSFDVDEDATFDVVVEGGTVFTVGGGDVVAYERRGDDYEERWSEGGPDEYGEAYIVHGRLLVVESGGDAEILDLDDGASQGRTRISEDDLTVITTESLLIRDDDRIEAYSLDDMSERWSLRVRDAGRVAVGGDRLFAIADDDLLAYS